VEYAIRCLQSRSFNDFLEDAELRDMSALLDEADLAMRYQSAVAGDEQVSDVKQTIAYGVQADSVVLNAGVVQERYNALMWLIGHDGLDWDSLSLWE